MDNSLNVGLARGLTGFTMLSPTLGRASPVLARIMLAANAAERAWKVWKGESTVARECGGFVASKVTKNLLTPAVGRVTRLHMRAQYVRMVNGRSWPVPAAEINDQGRMIQPLTIVYHHANKAGKHIDVHIGRFSLIVRVDGKPVADQIKFNAQGELTQASKDALLDLVRDEIRNHSRFPQNADHSLANAAYVWNKDQGPTTGYGSGPTRQVILRDEVEFYHLRVDSSLHMYAPALLPRGLYLYRFNEQGTTPIVIWGELKPREPVFEDRLHLKFIQEEDFEDKFLGKVDWSTVTRKYDGASCYAASNGEGVKIFSPRYSKRTGHRIEYTWVVPELAEKGLNPVQPDRVQHTVWMGEMMFWERTPLGEAVWLLFRVRGPEGWTWKYKSAAEIGGLLNANRIRPRDVYPEVRIYRVDRDRGQRVYGEEFFANRSRQQRIAKELSGYWKVVDISHPVRNEDHEGLVAVPPGLSVIDGLKVKWWGDEADWKVTAVNLGLGPKGAIAGTVQFQSLESGRTFKLGPGQLGTADDCLEIMEDPDAYLGRVAKVASRTGHEGRASKFIMWHPDK